MNEDDLQDRTPCDVGFPHQVADRRNGDEVDPAGNKRCRLRAAPRDTVTSKDRWQIRARNGDERYHHGIHEWRAMTATENRTTEQGFRVSMRSKPNRARGR